MAKIVEKAPKIHQLFTKMATILKIRRKSKICLRSFHYEHYFYIGKYTEKRRFSPYRAEPKREYLELGIEYLHSVKSAEPLRKNSLR